MTWLSGTIGAACIAPSGTTGPKNAKADASRSKGIGPLKQQPALEDGAKLKAQPEYYFDYSIDLAGAAGFEPATYGFGDRRSTS